MRRIRKVFNYIIRIILWRRRRPKGLSGLRRLAWEESFFLDPLDSDCPLVLWDLKRLCQEPQPRPEKKERLQPTIGDKDHERVYLSPVR